MMMMTVFWLPHPSCSASSCRPASFPISPWCCWDDVDGDDNDVDGDDYYDFDDDYYDFDDDYYDFDDDYYDFDDNYYDFDDDYHDFEDANLNFPVENRPPNILVPKAGDKEATKLILGRFVIVVILSISMVQVTHGWVDL